RGARDRLHRHGAVGARRHRGSRAPAPRGRPGGARMIADALRVGRLAMEFGGLRAVDDVSLTVGAGERRVLIGPNGAGKTTPFHAAAGARGRGAGMFVLSGARTRRLPEPHRTALGMSRTFQISNVFADLPVIENMSLAALGTDRRKWIPHRAVGTLGALRARG